LGGSGAKPSQATNSNELDDFDPYAFLEGDDEDSAFAIQKSSHGAHPGNVARAVMAIPFAVAGSLASALATTARGLLTGGLQSSFTLAACAAALSATPWGKARLQSMLNQSTAAVSAVTSAGPGSRSGNEHLSYIAELEEKLLALEAERDEVAKSIKAQVEAAKMAVVKKATMKIDSLVAANKKLKTDVASLQRRAASKEKSAPKGGSSGGAGKLGELSGHENKATAKSEAAAVAKAVATAVAAAEEAAAEEVDALRNDLAFVVSEREAAVTAKADLEEKLRAATAAASDAQALATAAETRAKAAEAQAAEALATAARANAKKPSSTAAKVLVKSSADDDAAIAAAVAAAVEKEAQRLGALHAEELRRLQAVMQAALAKQKAAKNKSKSSVRISHVRVD
jgi:hypothetical protein